MKNHGNLWNKHFLQHIFVAVQKGHIIKTQVSTENQVLYYNIYYRHEMIIYYIS